MRGVENIMIYHFDNKKDENLICGYELDKKSCIKCEMKLRKSIAPKNIENQFTLNNIIKILNDEKTKLQKFPGFLLEIKRKGNQIDHCKNWELILKNNSDYLVEKKIMIVVYIKFMKYNQQSYATNVGVTTLKSYNGSSLGDLSFSKNIESGVSKRLMYIAGEVDKLNWDTNRIYIIPVCCRRCAYNIEGKLRFDFNLLDT